ncbi:G1/S-specific cyclin-E [Strongyloides ratti]|uniref:G1/S-specific cyclin-E n=1 Tax=Strongyloides ratti TaxID=34506 RepID=A0A090LR85_STRRB|nr:G1/S-specific cyclin-E [Strongyloides ratti]CEF70677.1 G1/S-specific cyclin-E [Strongyloides ratti]
MNHLQEDDGTSEYNSNKSRKRAFEEVNHDKYNTEDNKQYYNDLPENDSSDDVDTHYSSSLTSSPTFGSLICNEEIELETYNDIRSNNSLIQPTQSTDRNNIFHNLYKNFHNQKKELPFESVMLRQTNTVFGNFEYILNYDKKSKDYQKKLREKYPHELYRYGQAHEVVDLLYLKSRIYPSIEAQLLPDDKKLYGKYRLAILEWLQEICYEEQISRVTYNSAINIMDRFMAENIVNPRYYQLISAAALGISAKMEEIYPISFTKIIEYTNGAYCLGQLKKAEIAIVNDLEFAINPVTCYTFLRYFHLKLQDEYDEPFDNEDLTSSSIKFDNNSTQNVVKDLAIKETNVTSYEYFYSEKPRQFSAEIGEFYIRTMAIHDFIFITDNSSFFSPSKLAAAIVYSQIPNNDVNLSNLVGYKRDEILEELNYVIPFENNSNEIELDYKEQISLLSETKNGFKKYDIQTASPSFRTILDENEKLREHIIRYNQKIKSLPLKI